MAREKCPFILKNGDNILSNFSTRTGVSGEIREFRVAINGWTTQRLLHNYGNHADILGEDLHSYAVDKGMPADQKSVIRLQESVINSQPVMMQYNHAAETWNLGGTVPDRDLQTELIALGERLDAMLDRSVFGARYRLAANSSYSQHVASSKRRFLVLHWDGQPTMSKDDVRAAILATLPSINRRVDDETVERVRDPLNWFQNFLLQGGIPMNEFKFMGYAGRTSSNPSTYREFDPGVDVSVPGLTVITGPNEANGSHRYPIWVGPYLGVESVAFHTAHAADSFHSAQGHYIDVFSSLLGSATVDYTTSPSVDLWDNWPVKSADYNNQPWRYWTAGAESTIIRNTGVGVYNYTLPNPGSEIDFLVNTENYVNGSGVELKDVISSTDWYMSTPRGLEGVDIGPGTVVKFGSAGTNYTVDGYTVSPIYMGFRYAFAAVRDYVQLLVDDPSTTAADKSRYQDLIADSQSYADGIISTKVYAGSITPSSMADVEALRIVATAAEAEEDLLNEDLGEGKTLLKAGKQIDQDRSDGTKYHSYSHLVDDVLEDVDVVSALVAPTLNQASLWTLQARTEVDESLTIIGSFGDSASPSVLTPTDAGVLYAYGAELDNVTLTADILSDHFGLGATFVEDILTLDKQSFLPASAAVSEGTYSIPDTLFSPTKMLDSKGYPVVHYPQVDSRTRAQLMFKGFGDPITPIALTMFFINNIDWT